MHKHTEIHAHHAVIGVRENQTRATLFEQCTHSVASMLLQLYAEPVCVCVCVCSLFQLYF